MHKRGAFFAKPAKPVFANNLWLPESKATDTTKVVFPYPRSGDIFITSPEQLNNGVLYFVFDLAWTGTNYQYTFSNQPTTTLQNKVMVSSITGQATKPPSPSDSDEQKITQNSLAPPFFDIFSDLFSSLEPNKAREQQKDGSAVTGLATRDKILTIHFLDESGNDLEITKHIRIKVQCNNNQNFVRNKPMIGKDGTPWSGITWFENVKRNKLIIPKGVKCTITMYDSDGAIITPIYDENGKESRKYIFTSNGGHNKINLKFAKKDVILIKITDNKGDELKADTKISCSTRRELDFTKSVNHGRDYFYIPQGVTCTVKAEKKGYEQKDDFVINGNGKYQELLVWLYPKSTGSEPKSELTNINVNVIVIGMQFPLTERKPLSDYVIYLDGIENDETLYYVGQGTTNSEGKVSFNINVKSGYKFQLRDEFGVTQRFTISDAHIENKEINLKFNFKTSIPTTPQSTISPPLRQTSVIVITRVYLSSSKSEFPANCQ